MIIHLNSCLLFLILICVQVLFASFSVFTLFSTYVGESSFISGSSPFYLRISLFLHFFFHFSHLHFLLIHAPSLSVVQFQCSFILYSPFFCFLMHYILLLLHSPFFTIHSPVVSSLNSVPPSPLPPTTHTHSPPSPSLRYKSCTFIFSFILPYTSLINLGDLPSYHLSSYFPPRPTLPPPSSFAAATTITITTNLKTHSHQRL